MPLTADEAEELLKTGDWLSRDLRPLRACAVRASRHGVGRVHLIGYGQDGALLQELLAHDGVATS